MRKKNVKNNLIIAGPCAIEGEEQFYNTVKNIYNYADIIRAGVWKARTSPKNYSGSGERALVWCQDIQNKYKIPVAIEVGNTKHVELALKHNIKILWIGARTTSNPFSVEEISQAIGGEDVEVWIKNPIISDIKLWLGAIQRFKSKGIKKLKTIHRGFYCEKKIKYRNNPQWGLLQNFIKRHPSIPIIADPSHISGSKKYIYEIAKKALQNKAEGLMLEVHCNPNQALSDKKQQLSPSEFRDLLNRLNSETF